MSLFTSSRERRLWLWALAVIVAIYATLGPARTLANFLRARNLLELSFVALVLGLAVALVIPWLKRRPGLAESGVALGIAFAYGLAFLRIENPAERTHLIEYGVVAALIHMALLERAKNGRPVPRSAALTILLTTLLGLLDESIQAFLPGRFFDWLDVIFNAFAAFLFIVARLALAPVRGPGWRLWFLWSLAGAFAWGWSMDPSAFGLPRPVELITALPPVEVPQYASVAAGSIAVGLLQWLLLRRHLAGAFRWALAGVAAAGAGALVVLGVGLIDAAAGWLAGVALYGTLAALFQWLVLRREVPHAGWWIPAGAAAWLVAIPAGDLNGPPGWAFYGAITGAVLVGLLRQRAPADLPAETENM